MGTTAPIQIGSIAKSATEEVRLNLFSGNRACVDIRHFYKTDGGPFLPTDRGARVAINKIDRLIALLHAARKAAAL